MKKPDLKRTFPGLDDWLYSILMYLMILLGAAVFIWIAVVTKSPNLCFDNEPIYPVAAPWDISYEGHSFTQQLPFQLQTTPGKTASYSIRLQKPGDPCNSVMFYTLHQYVKVYLDGVLVHTFGDNLELPFGMPPTSGWQFIRLPADWEGQTLRIELTGIYDQYSGSLDTVYLGTKNAFSFMILKQAAPNILICLPIIVGGFLLLVSSLFVSGHSAGRKMRSLGLFAIVTSAWILSESRISQMVFSKPLGGSLDFILFGLIPIILLRFVMTYRDFKSSRFIRLLYAGSLLNYVVIHILQISGTRNYIQMLAGNHIILLLASAYLLYNYIYQHVKKIRIRDKSIYYASFTLAAFGCVDIVRLYLRVHTSDAVLFTKIGLVFFIAILGYFAIHNASRDRIVAIEQQTLHRLAYTDMLTGLKNRTSFEESMEKFRKGQQAAHPVILMADVNNLKQINDTMGHTCGDQAIIYTARCLSRSFFKIADPFRIGGDEFCVIFEDVSDETLLEAIQKFRQLIGVAEKAIGFPFEVAVGYKRMTDETVDQSMIQADFLMYQAKASMKNGK